MVLQNDSAAQSENERDGLAKRFAARRNERMVLQNDSRPGETNGWFCKTIRGQTKRTDGFAKRFVARRNERMVLQNDSRPDETNGWFCKTIRGQAKRTDGFAERFAAGRNERMVLQNDSWPGETNGWFCKTTPRFAGRRVGPISPRSAGPDGGVCARKGRSPLRRASTSCWAMRRSLRPSSLSTFPRSRFPSSLLPPPLFHPVPSARHRRCRSRSTSSPLSTPREARPDRCRRRTRLGLRLPAPGTAARANRGPSCYFAASAAVHHA